MSKGDDDKKNPWGSKNGSRGGEKDRRRGDDRGPWGGSRPGGHSGNEPPDIDEMLRRAQDNFRNVMPGGFSGTPVIGLALVAILALWMASGFYVVNPGEHAVIQRFGAWSHTKADPGLGYHFPAPIETASILNVEEIRKMNIGFMESFSRNGNAGSRDVPEESLMLTSDRNIVDLDLVIQWNIKSAEDYLFEINDQENTIKKVAESAIREVVGQNDMFPIITTARDAVADRAKNIIQHNLDEYNSGVNITQVLIEKAEVHPGVQTAFQDVQSAKQNAEDKQNRATEYRNKIIPDARGKAYQMKQEAEGYKQSTVARATGDADRFNAVYEAYLSGKDVTKERIYLETMESVLGNAQKIILDGKAGQGAVPYLPLGELKRTPNVQQ
ncbi:MAG: FtsH protease activity modulator HflK [Rhodospirillales bacterium]|nr:FtsH protease activity modulator HflK [Rhodospirillales bacterium]